MTEIYLGLFQTLIIVVLSIFLGYKYADYYTKNLHFICPICRSHFKLSKSSFIVAFKTGVKNERITTCPVCGYKGKMRMVQD